MIRCPRCQRGDITAFRIVVQQVDDYNANGPAWYGDDPTGKQWLSCDDCGHSWDTKRYLG